MDDSGRSTMAPGFRVLAARLRAGAATIAALGALGLVASPAGAVSASVTPTNLILTAGDAGALTLRNPGTETATYDLRMGNYAIRADGSVRVDPPRTPSRSARDWLTVTPSVVRLEPGRSIVLRVASRRVRTAAPGDHHALVLITSRTARRPDGQVGVRARIGIGVIVRVPGGFRRKLAVGRPFAVRSGNARAVRVKIANFGNVNERFLGGQVRLELLRGGRVVGRSVAGQQSVLPGTSGTFSMPYRGRLRGALTARVTVRPSAPRVAGPGITSTPATIVRRSDVRF